MSTPIPRPGEHLPEPPPEVDPEYIHAEVGGLLARLEQVADRADDRHNDSVIPQQAQILERAHDVLVQALATVDKV